jgi:hypothetical protein
MRRIYDASVYKEYVTTVRHNPKIPLCPIFVHNPKVSLCPYILTAKNI